MGDTRLCYFEDRFSECDDNEERNGEVENMATKGLDFCCLQDTRWKSEDVTKINAYKFF